MLGDRWPIQSVPRRGVRRMRQGQLSPHQEALASTLRMSLITSSGFHSLPGYQFTTFPSGPISTVERECVMLLFDSGIAPMSKNFSISVRSDFEGAAKSQ